MIRLYTDRSLLIPENRKHAHPLIFDLHYYEHTPQEIFEKYELVYQIEKADAVLFPINYLSQNVPDLNNSFDKMLSLAIEVKKKLLVYTGGDYGVTFKNEHIITWRNAGFQSSNDKNTFILPAFMSDPLENEFLEFKLLDYQESPQISFTGFANANLKEKLRINLSTIKGNLKRIIGRDKSDRQAFYNAAGKRYQFLKTIESSNQITTDFIYRAQYRAGAITKEQRIKTTTEFFKNLNDSPYTFCLRGAGNFSVRFYESLALGRIPVLVDTDVSLPLKSLIDWDNYICRVNLKEDISKALFDFHKKFDNSSFKEMQKNNRKLYEEYLNRHAYLCQTHDVLKLLL